jgi:hypothetical protein
MVVSGQLHAPAALLPGKSPAVLIVKEAGWDTEPVWELWRREKSCHAGKQTRTVKPVARRYIDSSWRVFFINDMLEHLSL